MVSVVKFITVPFFYFTRTRRFNPGTPCYRIYMKTHFLLKILTHFLHLIAFLWRLFINYNKEHFYMKFFNNVFKKNFKKLLQALRLRLILVP